MLYEGGIREPLIVRWPGRVESGYVSETPVIGTDLYPTLLDIAGGSPPTNQTLDGVSLGPVLRGQGELESRALFWHFPAYLEADASVEGPWRTTPASAIRLGRYKLVHFFEDRRTELYDLLADPSESKDLSLEMVEKTLELRAMLESWWQDTGAFIPTEPNPLYDPSAGGS